MAPYDYDFSYEIEFATAIAAAAFAIHSVEEADLESENQLRDGTRASMSKVKTKKDDPSRPPESRQISSKEAESSGKICLVWIYKYLCIWHRYMEMIFTLSFVSSLLTYKGLFFLFFVCFFHTNKRQKRVQKRI